MDTKITGKMEKLVALCKRRGFIFQSSEIYGGINGFWDYGPLGVELKRNLREAWWQDVVRKPTVGYDGRLVEIVGMDSSLIMNPKVWVASGHVAGFSDPMVDCRESKNRYRADHLMCGELVVNKGGKSQSLGWVAVLDGDEAEQNWRKKAKKLAGSSDFTFPRLQPYSELSADIQKMTIGLTEQCKHTAIQSS